MDSDDGLSKAERELVVVATSGVNECPYCVVAHGAILRIRSKDPQLADTSRSTRAAATWSRGRARSSTSRWRWPGPRRVRRARSRRGPRRRAERGRDLGRRLDHRAVRGLEPARAPVRAAAQPRVLHGWAADRPRRVDPIGRARPRRRHDLTLPGELRGVHRPVGTLEQRARPGGRVEVGFVAGSQRATPIEIDGSSRRPRTISGTATSPTSRAATRSASWASGSRTANSSPLSRATVSAPRTPASSLAATSASRASPTS